MRDACNAETLPEAGLYVGTVMHARLVAPLHRFQYKVFSLFVDLDRLDALNEKSRLFSVDRANLVSFCQADHGDGDETPLRAFVDRHLAEAGVARADRVMLLAFPRILGYVFNPLSIYYCYDRAGAISAMIYEVRNTFGESHTYVAPVRDCERRGGIIKQERNKVFFVSPFLDMNKRYRFRVHPPGEQLRFRIFETDPSGPVLSATQAADWRPLTTGNLVASLLAMPLSMVKVIGGIHFEAMKLWLRGARYHRRGTPPAPVSYEDNSAHSELTP